MRGVRLFLFCLAGGFCVLGAVSLVLFFRWDLRDWSKRVQGNFDAIVVLGGGQQARADEAARLWKREPETPVIVTGDWPFFGDGTGYLLRLILSRGVDRDLIIEEPEADSTWENAKFTVPLLRDMDAKKVVLVTDWFHSERVLMCFRHFAPDMEFVVSCQPRPERLNNRQKDYVLREKAAHLFYRLKYRIGN